MVFGSVISSSRSTLSLQQALDLANVYLDNARKVLDPSIALVLCHDTELSLTQVKRAAKHTHDNIMREGIASVYIELADFLDTQGRKTEAQTFYKKSVKWGGRIPNPNRTPRPSRPISLVGSIKGAAPHSTVDPPINKPSPPSQSPHKQLPDTVKMAKNIFPRNVRPPTIQFNPPEPDSRLRDTFQLVSCLGLLQTNIEPEEILDPAARTWVLNTMKEQDERERLKALATDVIRAFKRDEFKDAKSVTEVVLLAPVLDHDDFRYLICVYSTSDWENLWTLEGHSDRLTRIVYCPDGTQIVSSSLDGTVRIWGVHTGGCLYALDGLGGRVYYVAYSPQGDQLASAHADGRVKLWNVKSGECLFTEGQPGRFSVHYSPHGDQVASASDGFTVRLWDTAAGVCMQTLTGHSSTVTSLAFSPRGDKIASGSGDNTIRLWDIRAGASTRPIPNRHTRNVYQVKCSPSGDHVATCSGDKTVRLWDIRTGVCRQTLRGHTIPVNCVDYSPHGGQITTGSEDGTVRLWNVVTRACTNTLVGHGAVVRNVVYSPQGDHLASTSEDMTVKLWDVKTGECYRTMTGHTCSVDWVVYSPNGNQIALCSYDDGTVRIWDIEAGDCKHSLLGHVRVWAVATGECLHIFIGHNVKSIHITYSTKGDQIASGDLVVSASDDKSVRVWDVISVQCRAAIQDFQSEVYDIARIESSNVNCLVAGCRDGVVGMWQVLVDDDHCDVSLKWKTTTGELDTKNADIHDAQGLSQLNRKLLKQRRAVGEPAHSVREASKKEWEQKLEQKFQQATDSLSQAKESLSQAKGSLIQDMMALEKNIRELE
ncbi:MAG: quinon protein alcohol dehydrogenase-like superfamily [Benniella sp.]|nr:MAG: quinon protein alcohol dehydrogenase-like superfamily [Benniella sp.]